MKAKAGRILVVKGERWYRSEVIMGRTIGAGPSAGHPFHCAITTLRICGKLIGVDANLVEVRCPQYKGSIYCPGRVSLNTENRVFYCYRKNGKIAKTKLGKFLLIP